MSPIAGKVEQYAQKYGVQEVDLCRRAGVSQSHFSEVKHNRKRPSYRMMDGFRRATNGEISPNDWFPPLSRRGKRARKPAGDAEK